MVFCFEAAAVGGASGLASALPECDSLPVWMESGSPGPSPLVLSTVWFAEARPSAAEYDEVMSGRLVSVGEGWLVWAMSFTGATLAAVTVLMASVPSVVTPLIVEVSVL